VTKSSIERPLDVRARDATARTLQDTLVDLIDLSLIGKQAHWTMVGINFRSVHLQLDELVATARRHADDVAELASALGVAPIGTARAVVEGSGLPAYPTGWRSDRDTVEHIVATLKTVIARLRPRIDETDEIDQVTRDLLTEIARSLEEAHWMWRAQLT
jgi:starvation-inducible DNA-binding protein